MLDELGVTLTRRDRLSSSSSLHRRVVWADVPRFLNLHWTGLLTWSLGHLQSVAHDVGELNCLSLSLCGLWSSLQLWFVVKPLPRRIPGSTERSQLLSHALASSTQFHFVLDLLLFLLFLNSRADFDVPINARFDVLELVRIKLPLLRKLLRAHLHSVQAHR